MLRTWSRKSSRHTLRTDSADSDRDDLGSDVVRGLNREDSFYQLRMFMASSCPKRTLMKMAKLILAFMTIVLVVITYLMGFFGVFDGPRIEERVSINKTSVVMIQSRNPKDIGSMKIDAYMTWTDSEETQRYRGPTHRFMKISSNRNQANSLTYVDYGVVGNQVEFQKAFDPTHPWSPVEDLNFEVRERLENEDIKRGVVQRNEVRMFIAITAAPCSPVSRERRNGIRETWIKDGKKLGKAMGYRFFVGQPDKCDPTMRNLLEEEHKQHGDIVFIRGHDSYNTLVNKTEGMLKYMFSLPENYTHVIKTDDDVYIRVRKLIQAVSGPKQMTKLYKGYMENPIGYQPFRDPKSKWFQNPETFTDEAAKSIKGTRYLVGWGYVLSRDVAFHAMKKVYKWHNHPETMPIWYERWLGSLEDVMTGILISDYVVPETDWRFRPSWRKCSRDTILRHLDIDSPKLLKSLHEHDLSGAWDKKAIQCSSGNFKSGDWDAWFSWRDSFFDEGQKSI